MRLRGAPKRWELSYGARVVNESISLLFCNCTFGSNKKQLTLFSFNSLSSSAAVVAFDTISLAPIPATPILVI